MNDEIDLLIGRRVELRQKMKQITAELPTIEGRLLEYDLNR